MTSERASPHPSPLICAALPVLALALALAMGCAESRTALCDNGVRCPLGQECAQAQDVCIDIGGCGNGEETGDETCDDGNIRPGDGCSPTCQDEGVCGNGLVEPGEACGEPGLEGVHCVHLGYDLGHVSCNQCQVDTSACQSFDWAQLPLAGQTLYGVWGNAAGLVLAVGVRRTFVTYEDGVVLVDSEVDELPGVRAVWGSGDMFAVAVDETRAVWFHDGASWSPSGHFVPDAPASEPSDTDDFIHGVWASGPSDIHAVGAHGVFAHFDGTAWSLVEPSPTENALYGVWGTGAGDVYAVGEDGVFHHDGAGWTWQDAPGNVPLMGVWGLDLGAGQYRVFAVGARGTIARHDGNGWTVDTPSTQRALHAIAGTGLDDIYAVGEAGLVLHHDGTGWSESRAPIDQGSLRGVWALDTGVAIAVGDNGRLLEHGIEYWREEAIPAGLTLADLSGFGSDTRVAVGANGTVLVRDGSGAWTSVPPAMTTTEWLHGAWVDATGIHAVGDGAIFVHGQGASGPWTAQRVDVPGAEDVSLRAVWTRGAGDGTVYAVGTGGVLVARSAGVWSRIPLPEDGSVSGDFSHLMGDATHLYIAGQGGLFRWGADGWRTLSAHGPLARVWVGESGEVLAAGAYGRIVGVIDDQSAVASTFTLHDLTSIAGSSMASGAFHAVGARDTVLDCRTSAQACADAADCPAFSCAPITPPADVRDFRASWSAPDGSLWLLSGTGRIHRLDVP